MTAEPGTELELADWRRTVARLYADVRFLYGDDPVAAWQLWRSERDALYRTHPQSPVMPAARRAFRGRYWGYDPRYAFESELHPDAADEPPPTGLAVPRPSAPGAPGSGPATSANSAGPLGLGLALPTSGGGSMSFRRLGWLDVPLPGGARRLAVYWMAGYAGGLFLPFRDATNGSETYGAGRYAIDAAKSADLGGDPAARTLRVDFNFSYQPSCAFDPKWACPLAPPENRLDVAIPAGERLG